MDTKMLKTLTLLATFTLLSACNVPLVPLI